MDNIRLYWKIGKNIYTLKDKCNNPNEYISNYYSYLYGSSNIFSRENINYMKNFYLSFPIYQDIFNKLTWSHFKLLLRIKKSKVRYFYYWISLFCNSSVEELETIINTNSYYRI